MNATSIVRSFLVLTALGSFLGSATSAQNAPVKKAEHATAQGKDLGAKPEIARAEMGHELAFSVTGLAQDNLGKIKDSLQALKEHSYVCTACKVEQATAGTCPKCKGALAPEMRAVFLKVQPSAEAGTVALTIEPKATLRLSELESVLAKNSVKIDPARFPLSGHAHLLVKGVTATDSAAVEKALTQAKLFEEVSSRFDAATNELVLNVRAGTVAPTRAKVAATLEGAKAQLTDVVWGPMMPKS